MITQLRAAVRAGVLQWQKHALERMLVRGISREAVKTAVESGEIIENYPNDTPFPSVLLLGWVQTQPIHVVLSYDDVSGYAFVITAYEPDDLHFAPDRKTRLP